MKPKKWTLEVLTALAIQYPSSAKLKKAFPGAYKAARQDGHIELLFPMSGRERHPEFTEAVIRNLAAPFTKRCDFQKAHPSAYNAAKRLNLITSIFPIRLNQKKWTKETLTKEALKYKTRTEFYDGTPGAYSVAQKLGMLEDICPPAVQGTSKAEAELLEFLQTVSADFKTKRFKNDYELDAYSESLKIGVEYNGLYWHSEGQVGSRYHLDKTKYFEEIGIRVIHIWEHEWRDRAPQVKNYLTSACNGNTNKAFARKCEFKVIDATIARTFLAANHIQKAPPSIKLAIGCYYKGTLVGVCTFGAHHREADKIVLNRWACLSGHTVVGGLSKCIGMAHKQWDTIYSWADYAKSQAAGYLSVGWKVVNTLPPDYFYVDEAKNYISKQSRRKKVVNTPDSMTESEHAKRDGLVKVWDCGKILLVHKAA